MLDRFFNAMYRLYAAIFVGWFVVSVIFFIQNYIAHGIENDTWVGVLILTLAFPVFKLFNRVVRWIVFGSDKTEADTKHEEAVKLAKY